MLKLIHWWFAAFTLHGGGKGGGGAAPPAPDYRGAAVEQAAASKELATGQTWANRPNLNTPWGQQTWTAAAGVDPSTGLPVTNWTSNINLTPEGQAALDAQQRITAGRSGAAETLLGQATGAFGKEFDWAGMPKVPGSIDEAQKGAYGTMSQMLQPGRQQQEAGLETKLANMGLPRGSEAWNREKAKLQGDWAQQDKSMMAQALAEGRADVGAQAQLRQQAIAEEAQRRGMSLNELNALLTGQQVSMPQMPSFMGASAGQAPNLLGAAQAQGQYGLGAASQNLAAQGSGPDIGSLVGSVGGIAAMAMMSDVRLKSNLRALGPGPRGLTVYAYEIDGREEIGVLAQEVAMRAPHLVVVTPGGHLAVCYGGL
jgi:hypothetical protein